MITLFFADFHFFNFGCFFFFPCRPVPYNHHPENLTCYIYAGADEVLVDY